MFLTIANRTYDFVSNNMPNYGLASAGQIAANIGRVALPIIALTMTNQMLFADAGPLTCAACLAGCASATWGGAPICLLLCAGPCAAPVP